MANKGINPPDLLTTVGQIRVLVGDTDPVPFNPVQAGFGQYAWYSDDELASLLLLFGDSPKRVAIWVLSQVSISMSLKLKKWTSDDLSVDGPAITAALEKTIARLAKDVEAELAGEDEFFGIYDTGTELDFEWPEASSAPYPFWR